MGAAYDYQFSPAVGRGVKERCAFLYKKERVSVIRPGELYPDTADGKDDFIVIRTGQPSGQASLISQ